MRDPKGLGPSFYQAQGLIKVYNILFKLEMRDPKGLAFL